MRESVCSVSITSGDEWENLQCCALPNNERGLRTGYEFLAIESACESQGAFLLPLSFLLCKPLMAVACQDWTER